jgi:hypothetical protein
MLDNSNFYMCTGKGNAELKISGCQGLGEWRDEFQEQRMFRK